MHKQQAQETMRVIEKNMTAEKKLKLEFLLNEIVDTYFALEIGKDNCKPLLELCFEYWTTYFNLASATLEYNATLDKGSMCADVIKSKIKITPIYQKTLSKSNYYILPTTFGLMAHECSHIMDFYHHLSHDVDENHKLTNPTPEQQLVRELTNRLIEYRQAKYPYSYDDSEIKIFADMIYLNIHHERYAREFELYADKVFQNAVNQKSGKSEFQEKIDMCNDILNFDYQQRNSDDKLIPHYLNNPKKSFLVLYNELLQELTKQVEQFVYAANHNKPTQEYEQFICEMLNLQAMPQFYNQEIIDEIKPHIQSLDHKSGDYVQSILLGVDKKTTKKDLDNHIKNVVEKDDKLHKIMFQYFDYDYLSKTYTNFKNKTQEK